MHAKGTVQEICLKYENLKAVDKVGQIQNDLQEVWWLLWVDQDIGER